MTPEAGGGPAQRRPPFTVLLELLALAGFAVAQPLLDVFGRSPEQFAFRNASPPVVVAFGVLVAFVPAAGLWLLELAIGLIGGPRARRWSHLVLLAGLAVLAAIHVVKGASPWRGAGLVVVVVAAGAAFAVLFARVALVRSWVRFASLAPVVFLIVFLVASPAADLLRPASTEAVSGVEVEDPAPVVMLVLDELPLASLIGPDGRIDADRYPGFAELAGASSWYRNATAVSSSTWHAVPSMLTGRYPRESAPLAADHPNNLFTLLGGSYELQVDESITRLCPTQLCRSNESDELGALRALGADARQVWRRQISVEDSGDDPIAGLVEPAAEEEDDGFLDFGRNQPTRYSDFLDGLDSSDEPALHYLHILLPHVPWRYLPSGRQYPHPDPDPGKVDEDFWSEEPWPAELGRQRHLLQVQYVDRLVQALLARLRETGLFDEALLVVASDHGVAFRPGEPVRGLEVEQFAEEVHPELMWVPLFVKVPGQRAGERSDANVQLVDVLPTIADALGIDVPWQIDGVSAMGSGRAPDQPKTFFQSQVVPFGVTPGERTEVDGGASWPLVLERSIPESLRGGEPLAAYRAGPRPQLVGRDVGTLALGEPADVTAQVDDADRLSTVDLGSGSVPSLVTGHLEEAAGDELVVLALGGRVAGAFPTYADDGEAARFAALLPEPLLEDGDQDLEIYLMDPQSEVLRPVPRN